MLNIQTFLNSWLLLIIFLAFVRIKWAVALFVAYTILVPAISLKLFGSGDNFMRLILLVGFFVCNRGVNTRAFKPFIPFLIYFFSLFCLIPFQFGLPYGTMIVSWAGSFFNTLILPILIWSISLKDSSSIKLFRIIFLICITIAILYGLFVSQLNGLNPYIMLFSAVVDTDVDMDKYFAAEGGGRLFGRVSSVFMHPMNFGLFIGLSLIYTCYVIKLNKWIRFFLIFAILIMSIICGVRSVIGGIIVATVYYLIAAKNYKLIFYFSVLFVILLFFISLIPDLFSYLSSIIDVDNDNQDVKGSSIGMRLSQLEGAISEASKNPLFGLGYGWTSDYLTNYGDHPICYAFESLIFVILCNSGLLGFFIWIFMIHKHFSVNKHMHFYQSKMLNSLMVYYVSYATITGDYAYMRMFLLFYVLMIIENISGYQKHCRKEFPIKVSQVKYNRDKVPK